MQTGKTLYSKLNSEEYWKILYYGEFNYSYQLIQNYKSEYRKRLMKVFLKTTRFCHLPLQDHVVIDVVEANDSFAVLFKDDFKIKLYRLMNYKYQKQSLIEYPLPLNTYCLQPHRHILVNNVCNYFKKNSQVIDLESIPLQVEFIDTQSEGVLFRFQKDVLLYFKGECIANFKSPQDIVYIINNRLELFIFTATYIHIYKLDFKKIGHDNYCKVYSKSISLALELFVLDTVEYSQSAYPFICMKNSAQFGIYDLKSKKFVVSTLNPSASSILVDFNNAACLGFSDGNLKLYDLLTGSLLNQTKLRSEIICLKLTNYFLFACTEKHLHILDSSTLKLKIKFNFCSSGAAGQNQNDFFLSPFIRPLRIFSKFIDNYLFICIFLSNGTVRFYELECFTYRKAKLTNHGGSKEVDLRAVKLSQRHSKNKELVQQLEYEQWAMEYDRKLNKIEDKRNLLFNGQSNLSEAELMELAMSMSQEQNIREISLESLEELAIQQATLSSLESLESPNIPK